MLRRLVVDRLDDLARAVEQSGRRVGQLPLLVAAQHGQEGNVMPGVQLARQRGADVRLVADDAEVGMAAQ